MKLEGKHILLGVTGGIAAYKSAALCRLFIKNGATVQVIMSKSACEFITPLTMETLSGNKVPVEMFGRTVGPLEHIEVPDQADIMVVAPATADYLARCSVGRASDLISSITLAFTGKIVAAPAMNTNMWNNPATKRNIKTLSNEHGWHMVQPGKGYLACGWTGPGRMAEPSEILTVVTSMFESDLNNKKILVTAGPTVEDIDPVRFLSNRSTGTMGYAVAEAASSRGADVILVSGPTALPCPSGVKRIDVRSALEMKSAVMEHSKSCDAIVMAAAVGDYRPAEENSHKIKKVENESERHLKLIKNPDILAELGNLFGDKSTPVLIGFALETQNLEASALSKLKAKKANIIVANLASDALQGANTSATIFDDKGRVEKTGAQSKLSLANHLLNLLIDRLGKDS